MQSLLKLLGYVKGQRSKILVATLYSILNVIFSAIPEIILGFTIDTVISRQASFLSVYVSTSPYVQLVFLGLISITMYTLESFSQYLYSVRWREIAQLLQHKLRLDAYRHVQKLDVNFFEEKSSGVLLNILLNDINLLEQFFNEGIAESIQLLTGFVLFCAIFLYLSPPLAFFSLVSILLIFLITFSFKDKLNDRYAKVRESAGSLAGILSNNILGMITIKNYTTEAYEFDQIAQRSKKYIGANSAATFLNSLFLPAIRMAMLIGYVTMLIVGGIYVLNDQLAIGSYTSLIFLYGVLLWPIARFGYIFDNYQRAIASANRVFNLLETPITAHTGTKELDTINKMGHIIFDRVSFTYPNGLPVLFDLSLEIKPNQTVAFVGPTGSGKTTITKLLLHHYRATKGTIYIDGEPVQDLSLDSLRNHFGVVSQDVYLIDGTIEENIRYGTFNASYEEVVQAAKAAHAYDFIMKLPEQFRTPIGERGQKLSGGQKQRISLARALLKKPPIFIFDEATSSLDNETERAIQQSLRAIDHHHTAIIIAHRLSTVRKADVIYVLKDGKIIEAGSHDKLVAAQGFYAYLWRLQTGEDVEDDHIHKPPFFANNASSIQPYS